MKAAVGQRATSEITPHASAVGSRAEHRFYVGAALLMISLSIAGFGPSILEQSRRNAPSSPMVMTHGMVVGAWLLLFLVQAALVATGRTAVHRRLGSVAPALALAMIVLGVVVLIGFGRRGYDLSGDVVRAISRTASPQNPAVILFPLSELVSFGVLVGLALRYRHRPDIHKRLMLLAAVPILVEPILHMVGHLSLYWPPLQGRGIVVAAPFTLLLLSATLIHDRVSRGRIHPANRWVCLLLLTWQNLLVPAVFSSTAWRKFAVWLIR
jgi:hypothetical protein